ncbi:MAG TPA: DUF3488 and transglutaminase-like domain-containing protein, partial [Pseudonocardia sp.]|nr:DUF3488 and transglutaminase-like domain-containing protein [Pseudonocardia sp.]
PVLVAPLQLLALVVLLGVVFSDDNVLGVLPGPGTAADLGALVRGAASQIDNGIPPVPATPEILLLLTASFGVLAIVVHTVAVEYRAPAAAGVPLLAVFAVPTALADDLLPWWAIAGAAAGFVVLLLVRDGVRQRVVGGAAVAAVAVVLALAAGAAAGMVGTSGRFGEAGSGGTTGSIGLSPFAALRGQLEETSPSELFRVSALPRPTYLRALTLREYVPDVGWQPSRPDPGLPVSGPLPAGDLPGEEVTVNVDNIGFRDYWLPLYGTPLEVSGVDDGTWAYDEAAGTAYANRPQREDDWEQTALLTAPTAEQLRAAEGTAGVSPVYLDVEGVDPRVAELAEEITADSPTGFDKAVALVDHFTGPGSTFRYDLQTAPGGGDDALVEFLTVGQVGYCEQFASAMAVMLRTVGVAARVAVGFTAGIDVGAYRSVTTLDAHAWVEAWFPGIGWTTFDPTPLTDGRAVVPPYVQEARQEAAGAGAAAEPEPPAPQNPAQEQFPEPQQSPEQNPAGVPVPADEDRGGPPLWLFAVLAVVVAAVLAPAVLRVVQRRRRIAAVAAGGRGAAAAGWAELLAESADRGVPMPPSDTVRGAARRIAREHHLDENAQQSLRQIVRAVEASWYGGQDVPPGELVEPVARVRAAIAASSPLPLRSRVAPRSLTAGRPRGSGQHDDAAVTRR